MDQSTTSTNFGDYLAYETQGSERIVDSIDNLKKLTGDEVKCNIGLIQTSFIAKGTGFVFQYQNYMIVVTASHVVIDPITKKYLRNLKFACGQAGKRFETNGCHWYGNVLEVMIPERSSLKVEHDKYNDDHAMKWFRSNNQVADLNYNFDIAVLKIEIPVTQQDQFANWKKNYSSELSKLTFSSWWDPYIGQRIYITGYP